VVIWLIRTVIADYGYLNS